MIDILVIGSMNVDQVTVTNQLPKIGETVIGNDFYMVPGGKGANQAVAAARMGAKVEFIGCIGNDSNGTFLIQNFINNKVGINNITKVNSVTGVASISVCNGQNSIIVVPGANYLLNKKIIDESIDIIKKSKIVLLQLEIPYEVVEYIIDICYKFNILVILNPAPAIKLTDNLINKVTYLTPNEHEASVIFNTTNYEDIVAKYPNKVVITLGDRGAIFHDFEKVNYIPAYEVEVVDTTGAGDTFNGSLAYSIINGKSLLESINFANKASALKIRKKGAQTGMPTIQDMEEFK